MSETMPRWVPETASRCESPQMRRSSSATVPVSRVRSPSSIPCSRSPPGPVTGAITRRNRDLSGPAKPCGVRAHGPASSECVLSDPISPRRCERRAHSSAGSMTPIAPCTLMRRAHSGGSAAPSSSMRTLPAGVSLGFTLTLQPYIPCCGSRTTVPTRSPLRLESWARAWWYPFHDASPAARPINTPRAHSSTAEGNKVPCAGRFTRYTISAMASAMANPAAGPSATRIPSRRRHESSSAKRTPP